mmetsp:Transcript_22206/g.39526  ORF Transcript_22206/g.39526 Transcript_22206/m.39526 type:complete len:93 (-) Transcript_22206:1336-1614(-)
MPPILQKFTHQVIPVSKRTCKNNMPMHLLKNPFVLLPLLFREITIAIKSILTSFIRFLLPPQLNAPPFSLILVQTSLTCLPPPLQGNKAQND